MERGVGRGVMPNRPRIQTTRSPMTQPTPLQRSSRKLPVFNPAAASSHKLPERGGGRRLNPTYRSDWIPIVWEFYGVLRANFVPATPFAPAIPGPVSDGSVRCVGSRLATHVRNPRSGDDADVHVGGGLGGRGGKPYSAGLARGSGGCEHNHSHTPRFRQSATSVMVPSETRANRNARLAVGWVVV